MAVVSLRRWQTHDPQRGSFIVQPAPKKHKGRQVHVRGLPVYRDKQARELGDMAGLEFVVLDEFPPSGQ